ncbi:MAG: molybdenum cofactor guanylyltransferase [Candidatus Omnitrophica bacterium]|nr:molybdenum cofactor guanylyltransferase [Candidatus Omnitrophota bacterium]
MDHEMTGIVLAGGKATRMGGSCDKAFLKIGGETIIERQLKALRNFFKEIIIVTNSPDSYKGLKNVIIVSDIIRSRGPIGGIYSGLLASSSFYNFVIACDMPFLNESVIRDIIKNKNGYDVIVPNIDGRLHPLFGIYSKDCISVIEHLIEQDELSVKNLFPIVRSRFLSRDEIRRFDEDLISLENINTKDDLSKAERMGTR